MNENDLGRMAKRVRNRRLMSEEFERGLATLPRRSVRIGIPGEVVQPKAGMLFWEIAGLKPLSAVPVMSLVRGRGVFVYLLVADGLVVYVGSTNQLVERLGFHHQTGKPFDDVYVVEVTEEERDAVESILIHVLRPTLNGFVRTRPFVGLKVAPIGAREIAQWAKDRGDERLASLILAPLLNSKIEAAADGCA